MQGDGGKAGAGMAGKARAEAADKVKIGRAGLRGLAKDLAGRGVDDQQAAAARVVKQAALCKSVLRLLSAPCLDQCLGDEKPKAPEEPLVDDFVTPRSAAFAALNFQPHEIAQHRAGRLVPRAAQVHEPQPLPRVTMKKGLSPFHDQDPF